MESTHPTRELGQLVRTAREEAGLSVRGLASAADVDSSWLSRLERGDYTSPDPRHLRALAQALGLDAAELFIAAGYQAGDELPAFAPYLRARYDELPAEAVEQLADYFDFVFSKYREEGGDDGRNHQRST
jgi:transcriptional regulator with XRE-family HTH domain